MIPQKNPLIASGESVHANMLTKLWENPDSSADFAAQNIALSSYDYDFLLILFKYYKSVDKVFSCIAQKGVGTNIDCPISANATNFANVYRSVSFVTSTSLAIGACDYQAVSNGGSVSTTTNNSACIPVAIYGFKKSLDITAIVSNISTDASKCMLSDGVTSVETALGDTTSWTPLGTSVISCKYRKKNGVVFIRFSGTNVTVSGSESIGTLPTGFRPLDRVTLRNAFTANNDGTFYINTDGTVNFTTTAGSGRYIEGVVSYPV